MKLIKNAITLTLAVSGVLSAVSGSAAFGQDAHKNRERCISLSSTAAIHGLVFDQDFNWDDDAAKRYQVWIDDVAQKYNGSSELQMTDAPQEGLDMLMIHAGDLNPWRGPLLRVAWGNLKIAAE